MEEKIFDINQLLKHPTIKHTFIPDFPNYIVDEFGTLYSKRSNSKGEYWQKASIQIGKSKKPRYFLTNKEKNKYLNKEELVAIAFIGPRFSRRKVYFIDGDENNFHFSNLEYRDSEFREHGDAEGLTAEELLISNVKHKYIVGFEDYIINEMGEIFTPFYRIGTAVLKGNYQKMKPIKSKHKLYVRLLRGSTRHLKYIHKLVAQTFLGEPTRDKPYVCHKNGNELDNRLENLKYANQFENMADRVDHGTNGLKFQNEDVHRIRRLIKKGISDEEIAEEYDVDPYAIYSIKNNITWKNLEQESPKLIVGDNNIDDRGIVSFVNNFDFNKVKRFYIVENHNINTIRGMHSHFDEGKYIYVVKGTALIVAVNTLTQNSIPESFVLSENQPKFLYVPPGFAQGFKTLSYGTKVIFYSTSTLEQSQKDDFRFPWNHWGEDIWKERFR